MAPSNSRAIVYSAIVALGGLIFGLDAVLISGGVDLIREEFSLSDWGLGFVVSSPGLGVLFALLATGWFCNALGRKKTLLGIAFIYVLSAIWSAVAPSWWQLAAARFLGGLAFTSLSLGPMYIGEIAPSRWRGKLVTLSQINTVIGLSGAYFINLGIVAASQSDAPWIRSIGLEPDNLWRHMLGSEIPPALLWFGLLFLIPESPRWLMFRGRDAEAEAALRRIAPESEFDERLAEIKQGLDAESKNLPVLDQVYKLLKPGLRTAVIIGLTIAIAQQATGINAIYFYAPTVFKQLGFDTNAAFVQAAVMGVISAVFAVLALFVVDRLGRRPVVLLGFFWIIASLGLCAYGFSQAKYRLTETGVATLPAGLDVTLLSPLLGKPFDSDMAFKSALAEAIGETEARRHENLLLESSVDLPAGLIVGGILSFIAAFQFSVGPVMWILLSEIFPTSVRGVAIPIFHFVTGMTSYVVQFLFPVALSTFGAAAVFGSFIAIPLLGLIVLHFCLPETKNLSIEEIQAAFAGKSAIRSVQA
ncbi:MFS transporter [Botrimarina hoheduenensis]|uniref:Arabinose-proton symporter n=1 Tax=Botrimarina hoheduenensis TaxID=2528000 RepID=A0A5C5VSV7_9BACT|nr:MFS transporter [Botrimarina hoheduenensis]TWT40669.1 Arabinose-proton symporter [Botrimarina hoheduenensis]